MGLDGEADDTVGRQKKQAQQKLEKYMHIFGKDNFAISTQGFFFTPYLARIYADDLKLSIRYFCVDTKLLKTMNISDETIEIMMKNMFEAFDAWDLEFDIIIDPTLEEMSQIAKKVDHFLSDRLTTPLNEKNKNTGMLDISATRYLLFRTGFNGIVEFGKFLANKLHTVNSSLNRSPIISRFNYDRVYYPMLEDPVCSASREMWSGMWSMKSEGGDNNGRR